MIFFHGALAALDLIGVEDGDDLALLIALIVAQQIAQALPGRVQALLGQGFQLVPGEDDVIAVHQQVLRTGGLLFHGAVFGRGGNRAAGGLWRDEIPALHRAVGPLENGLQLLVLFDGAGVGGGAGPGGFRIWPRFGDVQAEAAVHMSVGGNLAPLHVIARSVGAENGVRRVLHVPLRVVANGLDHALRVRAGA